MPCVTDAVARGELPEGTDARRVVQAVSAPLYYAFLASGERLTRALANRPPTRTVDLPAAVHRRATELARARGQSLSGTIAELTAQGLSQLDEPLSISIDERSGFPVLSVGRRITSDDVATALDDE